MPSLGRRVVDARAATARWLRTRDWRWIAALLAVLLLAAVPRFVGLGHELQSGSGPMIDEANNFVRPTLRMWQQKTPDPTVCSGYAGVFNYLILIPVALGHRLAGDLGAYVGARAFVAIVGLLNIVLVYALVRRSTGPGAALFSALLVAVSRTHIREAHQVSPDVVVCALMLLLLLVFDGSPTRRQAVLAGTLVGVAIAVKYTGIVLLPGVVVGLWPGRRAWSRTGLALLATGAAFALSAPYAVRLALSGGGRFGMGLLHPLAAYYVGTAGENRFVSTGVFGLGNVLVVLAQNLGVLASVLALVGLLLSRPWRAILPTAAIAGASALALGAANYTYPRHGLLMATALASLAGLGLSLICRRGTRRGLVAALAGVALIAPAATAVPLVRGFVAGAPPERAARWLEGSAVSRANVVTSWALLKVDPERFEVLHVSSLRTLPRPALESFSFVLTSRRGEVADLAQVAQVVQRFAPNCVLFRPGRAIEWRPVRPRAWADSSGGDAGARAAYDGDRQTVWIGGDRDALLMTRWDEELSIEAVEIDVGRERLWPRELGLEALGSDGAWRPVEVTPLRPQERAGQRHGSRPGQLYLFGRPETMRGLRVANADQVARWGVAELRLLVSPGE